MPLWFLILTLIIVWSLPIGFLMSLILQGLPYMLFLLIAFWAFSMITIFFE